jgi:hypothetical protein
MAYYNTFHPFIKFDEGKSFGLPFVYCVVIWISYGGACLYCGTITSMEAGLSGVPRNFVWRGGATNLVEDREKRGLGAAAP